MRVPGVPKVGPNRDAFMASFWAGLYSGFLYSIFTGFFVGLAVWLVQRHADQGRVRNDLERELIVFRAKLQRSLATPSPVVIGHACASIEPQCAVDAARLLEEHPLELWLDNLPGHRPFILQLKTLLSAHADYLTSGRSLELELCNFIRNYHASKEIHHVNDNPPRCLRLGQNSRYVARANSSLVGL
jgi:hypothetical protein